MKFNLDDIFILDEDAGNAHVCEMPGTRYVDLLLSAPELKTRTEALETALTALLERTPYTEYDEYDFCECAFCGCDYDAPHEEDCAWAQARKLLEVKG
jgi:hypothetical protein